MSMYPWMSGIPPQCAPIPYGPSHIHIHIRIHADMQICRDADKQPRSSFKFYLSLLQSGEEGRLLIGYGCNSLQNRPMRMDRSPPFCNIPPALTIGFAAPSHGCMPRSGCTRSTRWLGRRSPWHRPVNFQAPKNLA
jgi:hypothetical protein